MKNPSERRELARQMRKAMTPAEQLLWLALRGKQLGVRFRRQAPIGPYIVDFVCFEKRLIVELDGEYHAYTAEQDEVRQRWLESQGFEVVRLGNRLVLTQLEDVVAVLLDAIDRR
jgi:very-short-patch-repair endonuclease